MSVTKPTTKPDTEKQIEMTPELVALHAFVLNMTALGFHRSAEAADRLLKLEVKAQTALASRKDAA